MKQTIGTLVKGLFATAAISTAIACGSAAPQPTPTMRPTPTYAPTPTPEPTLEFYRIRAPSTPTPTPSFHVLSYGEFVTLNADCVGKVLDEIHADGKYRVAAFVPSTTSEAREKGNREQAGWEVRGSYSPQIRSTIEAMTENCAPK